MSGAGDAPLIAAWLRSRARYSRSKLLRKSTVGDDVSRAVWSDYFFGAVAANDALTATDIAAGSPFVGEPGLVENNVITATGVTSAAPSVGGPSLTENLLLTATSIVAQQPSVGAPALEEAAPTTTGRASIYIYNRSREDESDDRPFEYQIREAEEEAKRLEAEQEAARRAQEAAQRAAERRVARMRDAMLLAAVQNDIATVEARTAAIEQSIAAQRISAAQAARVAADVARVEAARVDAMQIAARVAEVAAQLQRLRFLQDEEEAMIALLLAS